MCRRPSSFSTRTVYTTLRQGWMMKHIQSLLTISATRIIPLVIRKSRNVAFGRKPSHSTSRISRYSTRASRARNSELSKRQTSKMWSRKCIRLSSEDVISELTQRNRRLLSDTGGVPWAKISVITSELAIGKHTSAVIVKINVWWAQSSQWCHGFKILLMEKT